MALRNGYTVTTYCLDVSPGMADLVWDEERGREVSKLSLCVEYICRKIAPKIQSGRKTDHISVILFGNQTDNPYFTTNSSSGQEQDPLDYIGVASLFPPQQARPSMIKALKSVECGDGSVMGNAIASMFVAEELLRLHKGPNRSAGWRKELVLLTHESESDGDDFYFLAQAKLKQGGWENLIDVLKERAIVLRVIGVGYDDRGSDEMTKEEISALPKTEKFWRTFAERYESALPQPVDENLRPALGSISIALSVARGPSIDMPASSLGKAIFSIGAAEINEDEAISFPIRWSKATAIAKPMSLKKVLAKEQPRQLPPSVMGGSQAVAGSQRSLQQPQAPVLSASADLTAATVYVIKKLAKEEEGGGGGYGSGSGGGNGDYHPKTGTIKESNLDFDASGEGNDNSGGQEEILEEKVEKHDLTKAYRFGSTWVPVEDEDPFPVLQTSAGMDVVGFIKAEKYQRYHSIGEVYYIWPDPEDRQSQIKLSALVEALVLPGKESVAITRWVQKDDAAPKMGVCVPVVDEFENVEYMYWVQLPFAEDERSFLFPSLSDLYSRSGKKIEEHKLLPSDELVLAIDQFVEQSNLDTFAEEGEDGYITPYFEPSNSYNPSIHRLKEAVYHQATTSNLNTDPVPDPHPELIKFFNPPEEMIDATKESVQKILKIAEIKVVPARTKKMKNRGKNDVNTEIDIDALFSTNKGDDKTKSYPDGRMVSDDDPLADLERHSGRDGFDKVLLDCGEVVKETVATSMSTAKFSKAIKIMQGMRSHAAAEEEVETYNKFYKDLRKFINRPDFKHPDFWDHVKKAEPGLGPISDEEAAEAQLGKR